MWVAGLSGLGGCLDVSDEQAGAATPEVAEEAGREVVEEAPLAPAEIAPDQLWLADSSEDKHRHDSLMEQMPRTRPLARGPVGLAPSCARGDLMFTSWPVSGTHGKGWMINNYTDLNATASATRDYQNNTGNLARTYDGHRGADIDISSFREMDSDTAKVRAAAASVVEFIREDQFDRHTSCTGTWNVVVLRHANGYASFYGHVKRNSVVVNVGDNVVAGQTLAVVGSSGCSTQAHLHFEVQDCGGVWLESFDDMWQSPPAYQGPSDVMDVMLKKGAFASSQQIKDPAPNVTLYKPGDTMGIGLSAAIRGGDTVKFDLFAPGATIATATWSWTAGGVARYTHSYPSWTWNVSSTPGTWTMRINVNGSLKQTRTFRVSNYAPGLAEVARHGVSSAGFQTAFDDAVAGGYRPVWIDGFNLGSSAYFNMLFRPADGVGWSAWTGMTPAQ